MSGDIHLGQPGRPEEGSAQAVIEELAASPGVTSRHLGDIDSPQGEQRQGPDSGYVYASRELAKTAIAPEGFSQWTRAVIVAGDAMFGVVEIRRSTTQTGYVWEDEGEKGS